jgi:uncharacterized protein (DUF305 family)
MTHATHGDAKTSEGSMPHHASRMSLAPYVGLAIDMVAHFAVMYVVMYAMVASLDHVYPNLNTAWMTLMMVAPMAVIMQVTMRSMFPSRWLNLALIIGAVVVFVGAFYAIRTQALIGDEEFLRSMIPHHSGAILMCEQARITDVEIASLCDDIVRNQADEIAQMEAILGRLDGGN